MAPHPAAASVTPLRAVPAAEVKPAASAPVAPKPPAVPPLLTFVDLVAFVTQKRDMLLKTELEERVRLVRYEPLRVEFSLMPGADPTLVNRLAQKLGVWTGERWVVALSREPGAPPLIEELRKRADDAFVRVRDHATVKGILARIPGAELVAVRSLAVAALPVPAAEADDIGGVAERDGPPDYSPDFGEEPPPADPDDYGLMDLDED
jgi:DNA polymerase III subunit gamma/tau